VLVNVTGFTTATTTGGTIANLSIADNTGGGAWRVSNPFGAQVVDTLKFVSADPGPTAAYSDFAIGETNFRRAVPEPATLLLLGIALPVAARLRRQR
jgi:hypothetical protein